MTRENRKACMDITTRNPQMNDELEPALDSCAGHLEIAIYMASEIEQALEDICRGSTRQPGRDAALRDEATH